MGKQSAPPNQGFQQAAEQQAASSSQAVNRQTQANRPNINTPFGFQGWEQGPNGEWTLNAGLSPQVQSAYQNMKPFDLGQFGQMGTGDDARNQAITAAYGQATSRLDPQFAQRETQLRSQLANQGLDPNSEAARGAMAQFGQARNDAYGSAMNSAIGQGQAAGDSVFRNNLMARQNAIAEALKERSMPLSDLQGLQGFMQTPSFMGAQARDPAQYLNAAISNANYQSGNANQQNANQADVFGGLAQAGISLLPFLLSDERLKQNIVRLEAEALPGVPWALWEYRDAPGTIHAGVIAQDLEKVSPELVVYRADGMRLVNYAGLVEAMR